MSYILYLSLRWSHEVGSCTIAISVMTAIKHYLFCYRLDFNQNSLNYTVVNAQSTVPNAQPTVHWTLLTEWCLTSYISVYLCRMKLGIVTFDQCEMTAIKWCLFSYRLHFNQISLNYTVVNAQSTVPNAVNCAECTVNCAERTVNCALDIVNRMMSYILYISLRWSHEVGSCNIVISVRWQLSNDIYLVIDYILTRYR